MKKYLILIAVAAFTQSCKKEKLQPESPVQAVETATGKTSAVVDKYPPAATWMLVKTSTGWCIGVVNDGWYPPSISLFNSNVEATKGILSSGGTLVFRLQNPSLLGGLPANMNSSYITGLALDRVIDNINPDVYVSYAKPNVENLIFKGRRNLSDDIAMSSVVTVTTSFATAASGWRLNHIESYGTEMYGLLYNATLNETKVISINPATGTGTLLTSLAGKRIVGMDFNKSTSAYPYMYLLSDEQTGTTQGVMIRLDFATLTPTTTNLNVPLPGGTYISHGIEECFFAMKAGSYQDTWIRLSNTTSIYKYLTATSTLSSYFAQWDILTLPNTFASASNFPLGVWIGDAAN
ncbi:MAG: hypothetical protein ACO1O6_09260 [Bacteroidota bacterium]